MPAGAVSENEEQSWWRDYRRNGSRKSRERLILHYLGLVKYAINRLPAPPPPAVRPEDLISSGIIGLIDAIEKFDLSRGNRFSTYAVTRIRGAVLDELRRLDWLPREQRRKQKERTGSVREPAERQPVDRVPVPVSIFSLEEPGGGDEGRNAVLMERIEDRQSVSPESAVVDNELKAIIADEIALLPEKERRVITLYYFENKTLKEIGAIMDLSESRISQIHSRVILVLRRRFNRLRQEAESG